MCACLASAGFAASLNGASVFALDPTTLELEVEGRLTQEDAWARVSALAPAARNRLEELALQEESLLLLGAGSDSFRLRPNLSVTEADIAQLLEMLERSLRRL